MSAYSSNSTIPGAAATEPLVAKPQGRIRKGVVVAAALDDLALDAHGAARADAF